MNAVQVSGIDLNLLVVLDALLQTRSVKEAADRVSVSPSAVSHALARLRSLFDDPLLIRAGRSMVLSARAEELCSTVREAMMAAERVFAGKKVVDPATLKQRFTVVSTDYATLVLLQPLGTRLKQIARGVQLYERRGRDIGIEYLRHGTADIGLGVYGDVPADIIRQPILTDRLVCLLRSDHPVLAKGLSLDAFCDLEHVLVSPDGDGRGVVDAGLEDLGRSRHIARTTGSFLAAPHLLLGTDLVLTMASRLAVRYAALLDLVVVNAPLELPQVNISLLWHCRSDEDGAHRWLRDEITKIAAV